MISRDPAAWGRWADFTPAAVGHDLHPSVLGVSAGTRSPLVESSAAREGLGGWSTWPRRFARRRARYI